MRVLILGATGMVGQGALREALLDPDVTEVVALGRSAVANPNPKLRNLVHPDLYNLAPLAGKFGGFDACFFCIGQTSTGMSEPDYRRVTVDLTVSVATALAVESPQSVFVFVSGAGTDGTERGRIMWARIKGAAENAVLAMPFRGAYMLRPGVIQPMHGIRSRTPLYRIGYVILAPLVSLVKIFSPNSFTTTERMGLAMLEVAKHGWPTPILELADINAAAARTRTTSAAP